MLDKETVALLPYKLVTVPSWGESEWGMPRGMRADEAFEEIHRRCTASAIEQDQWLSELSALTADDVTQIIITTCIKYEVTPDELLAEMTQVEFGY